MFGKGEFVILNDQIGVVILTGLELGGDREDHTGVWFGTCHDSNPEVWTVLTEYLREAPSAVMKH
jgi:hypothetical protein